MPPSMIFDDFERFCIHGESKATPGATKMNAFLYIFAGQSTARVFDQCNTRASHFLWSFCDEFSTILNNFCIHGVSKATAGTTKMTAFLCIFISLRRRAFLTIAKPEVTFFRAHFKLDLEAFSVIFARFFGSVRALLPSLRMVLGARQNA